MRKFSPPPWTHKCIYIHTHIHMRAHTKVKVTPHIITIIMQVQLIREIRLHGSFVHRHIIELYVAFQVGAGRVRV